MKYTAKLYSTLGFGKNSDVVVITATTYTELNNLVADYLIEYNGKAVTFLGLPTRLWFEKIIYHYPSGKTYTKNIYNKSL